MHCTVMIHFWKCIYGHILGFHLVNNFNEYKWELHEIKIYNFTWTVCCNIISCALHHPGCTTLKGSPRRTWSSSSPTHRAPARPAAPGLSSRTSSNVSFDRIHWKTWVSAAPVMRRRSFSPPEKKKLFSILSLDSTVASQGGKRAERHPSLGRLRPTVWRADARARLLISLQTNLHHSSKHTWMRWN